MDTINERTLFDMSEFFKTFGDSTRVNIIYLLLDEELNVNTISEKLNMTPSSISHQLRILKAHRFVKVRKDGKHSFYSLDDLHIKDIFNMTRTHIEE